MHPFSSSSSLRVTRKETLPGTSSALAFSPLLSQSEGNLHMNLSEEQEALIIFFAKEKEVGEVVVSPNKKLRV
jgi:hypothetical protein